ncbi:MAG: type II secretion system protein [Candidatus Marinimicrobia bacterium]|nr:type II secretion system protein [Candidatus Neomarinimicrobiota bacterium]
MMARFSNIRKFLHDESGTTLVEVMAAIFISTIIMIGGSQFFYQSKRFLNQEKNRRIAITIAEQKIEATLSYPYDKIIADLTEVNTLVDGKWTRTTTFSSIDDSADGTGANDLDGNTDDYWKITVTVNWGEQPNKSVSVESYISEYWQP